MDNTSPKLRRGKMAKNSTSVMTNIEAKLDLLLKGKEETDAKLALILSKLSVSDKEIQSLKSSMKELEEYAEFSSKEIETLKEQAQEKNVLLEGYATLLDKVDDLENRSKRNNIVLWNIPENAEKGKSCEEFIHEFIKSHMKLEEADKIEIERAHRTPPFRKSDNNAKPRPIHAKILRYSNKQRIMKAAKGLKDNLFQGAKVFISDDVSLKVRRERNFLKLHHLEKIKSTHGVQFAFIPFQVPARICYKDSNNVFHSIYYNDSKKATESLKAKGSEVQ